MDLCLSVGMGEGEGVGCGGPVMSRQTSAKQNNLPLVFNLL